jgi:hypothetical protein
MRIRILVRLLIHKKLNFYMKNIFTGGFRSKNIPRKVKTPGSGYGSGSRTAK